MSIYDEIIKIDVDKLRNDMKNDSLGAFFGGGFGGALFQTMDIGKASDEKLVEIALQAGIDLRKYQV